MSLPPISKLLDEARTLLPDAVALRRKIHENPELGLELPETAKAAREAIADLGLDVKESRTTSGFVATLRGAKPGPCILLRADMDALPMPEDTGLPFASRHADRMHACGHDVHTAMLAGAARLLDRHRDAIEGSVQLFFQAGEEGHFGARFALDEGLFDGDFCPEAAFAIHVDPRIPVGMTISKPGPILAAADTFKIELKGKGGHASMPHDTRDPLPVACEIVQALQSFVTRRINVFDPIVLTVSKIVAGTTANVIPETAECLGTLRSFSPASRELAHAGLDRVARHVAAAHEVEIEIHISRGYPVTVNDEGFTRFAEGVAREVLGAKGFVEMPSAAMGAEDFSYLLERWPGAMFFLGVRPEDPELVAPCHSNRMVANEEGMAAGIALHTAVALRYLEGRVSA